jgi:MFS family permease
MSGTNATITAQQSKRFLYLYALAVSGGSIAYIPFLTILLPVQASTLVGNSSLTILAYAAFSGAISASIANIGFGWASDLTKTRRPWIAVGLVFSSALLLAMQLATSANMLIIMIICWQLCLNMMLAPLAAWGGDCVPDSQKGLLGGLLALAPALGALSGALVTLQGFASASERLSLVAAMVVIMVGPVLVFGRPVAMPQLMEREIANNQTEGEITPANYTVLRMWLARLLVQIAEASLFAFLLMWFRSVEPGFGENDAANIFTAVLGFAVFLALFAGRWSDRTDRPIFPLALCSAIAAAGLFIMSIADGLPSAIFGYSAFGLASSVFLALHSSQTLRVLPEPRNRGRYLGLFNLTNTVPSLIMPWLILALVPAYGFDALFLLLAGLAIVACVMLVTMPRRF